MAKKIDLLFIQHVGRQNISHVLSLQIGWSTFLNKIKGFWGSKTVWILDQLPLQDPSQKFLETNVHRSRDQFEIDQVQTLKEVASFKKWGKVDVRSSWDSSHTKDYISRKLARFQAIQITLFGYLLD